MRYGMPQCANPCARCQTHHLAQACRTGTHEPLCVLVNEAMHLAEVFLVEARGSDVTVRAPSQRLPAALDPRTQVRRR